MKMGNKETNENNYKIKYTFIDGCYNKYFIQYP